jgi:hypothetical protein
MQRKGFFEVTLGVIAGLALVVALIAPSTAGVTYASENSAPEAPKVDPAVERQEQFIAAQVEEGSKIENRSTSGVVSDAAGLYFTHEVTGVAIKANAGASLQGTTVAVADTDTSKSSAAMACVNAAAAASGLTVGPSVDIYAKGTNATISNMGEIYVGLPANFQGGTSYSAVVVAPGGATTVLPATVTADGKSVSLDLNGLTGTSRTAGQILISICKK